jgi:hypothetical protein
VTCGVSRSAIFSVIILVSFAAAVFPEFWPFFNRNIQIGTWACLAEGRLHYVAGRMVSVEELLDRIKVRLAGGTYPNEASISHGVVMPILGKLGWDGADPEQVMPEYSSGGRRVDFALCGSNKRPSLFIEVKGVGRTLEGDRQLFEYAFHEGIPLCLLTDGREWSFYLPGGQGSYDERRVYRLQLDQQPTTECARILNRYLAKQRIKSGDAFEDALRDHRDIASQREAKRALPQAWAKLVDEPEDLLVELLTEQTDAVSGFRPTSEEVIEFLRSLHPASIAILNSKIPQPEMAVRRILPPSNEGYSGHRAGSRKGEVHRIYDQSGAAAATAVGLGMGLQESTLRTWISVWSKRVSPSRQATSGNKKNATITQAISYELFGERRSAPTASMALIEILREIAKRHPAKLEEIAQRVRGKSRNHIARSPAEIYPARPDLARAAEIAPGWLVGLNIANREKDRLIKGACDATGVVFGKDVVIDFPNTDG